jgi:hypothetical protein
MSKPTRLYLLCILGAFLIALAAGLAGVDFGTQWDQNNIKGFVNKYIRTGNILAGEYHYPPVSLYIATTTTIPYALPSLLRYGTNWTPTQEYLLNDVLKNPNQAFLLNLRRVFVFFTVLTILWVGFAAGQRNWLAGAVAAGLLAFSWEVNYQSRFVHPDGPTMQFFALAVLFAMLAFYRRKPFSPAVWLYLAAAASAVATATKYTAGISLLVVLLLAAAVWQQKKETWPQLIFSWATLITLFVIVFLILVPGVILESSIFFQQVARDQAIYAAGHGLQTVEPGWDYLSRVFVYLFAVAFSVNPGLALMVTLLILLGVYSLLTSKDRTERWLVAALFGVPTLYILFLATHRVLFVRNLLHILPGFAILAGLGFAWAIANLKRLRPLAIAALLLILAVNGYWIAYSAWTILARNTDAFATQALAYVSSHPDQNIYITSAAQAMLAGHPLPENVSVQRTGPEDLVLFAYLADAFDEEAGGWPVNALNAAPLIFGPREINMDWFASWPGVERLVLATPEIAWEDGRKFQIPPPEQQSPMPLQEATGILILDGQQFLLELPDGGEIFILNSSNPNVVRSLRPHLESELTITGRPYTSYRLNDWLLQAVDGELIISEEDLRLEYNFSKFFLQLTDAQRSCLEQVVGPAYYQALRDHAFGFMALSDDTLQQALTCTD